MVSEVVDPPERLRERAQELGETIARNSPAAMAATKRALWGALEMGLTDACRNGAQELVSMWGHPDQAEGPEAFAEKRERAMADLSSPTCCRPPGDERRRPRTRRRVDRARSCASGSTSSPPTLDVEPGTAVGVSLPNGGELIATLFAVWRAGAVYVPVNPRLTADRGRRASSDEVVGRRFDDRRRPRVVHLGHDRAAQAGAARCTTGCSRASTRCSAPCAAKPGRRRRRCRTSSRCRCRCGPASTRCCSPSASARRSS